MARIDSGCEGHYRSQSHYRKDEDTTWGDIKTCVNSLNSDDPNGHVFEIMGDKSFIVKIRNGNLLHDKMADERWIKIHFDSDHFWSTVGMPAWPSDPTTSDDHVVFVKEMQISIFWTSQNYFWTKGKCNDYEYRIMTSLGFFRGRYLFSDKFKRNAKKKMNELSSIASVARVTKDGCG